jgi:hypothetical protein
MQQFAIKYRDANKALCDQGKFGLADQILSADEWDLAAQLSSLLKVCCHIHHVY